MTIVEMYDTVYCCRLKEYLKAHWSTMAFKMYETVCCSRLKKRLEAPGQ